MVESKFKTHMSKSSSTTLKCTGCGAEAQFTTWESLNVSLNPEQKEPLLKGELTLFTCKECGWSGHVVYPMLYHDMKQKFMVWLVPNAESNAIKDMGFRESMANYRFRRVSDLNELKEKIYLFDEGYDDREMEVLKLIIEMRSAQTKEPITGTLLFSEHGTDEAGSPTLRFAHLGKDGVKSLSVGAQGLADVAASLEGKLPSEQDSGIAWPTVDRAFAMEVMKSVGKQGQGK